MNKVVASCEVCGKEFLARKRAKDQRVKTCSNECRYTLVKYAQRGRKRPERVKKQIRETIKKRYPKGRSIYGTGE